MIEIKSWGGGGGGGGSMIQIIIIIIVILSNRLSKTLQVRSMHP